jgi:hypothetical protein
MFRITFAPDRVIATVALALLGAIFLAIAVLPIRTSVANTSNITSAPDTKLAENDLTANYGGATTSGVDGDIPATGRPVVFAHWHHSTQRAVRGANSVSAYEAEIRKAKAMGIDAFAYNIISWNSTQRAEIDNLYAAASNVGGFYLFPSADQCCGMSEATLDSLATYNYNHPARLRVDGGRFGSNLPVMQTWHGENKGVAEWKRIQNEWKNAGKPMFFVPYFSPSRYGGKAEQLFAAYDGADPRSQADDVVDGFFNFSAFAGGTNIVKASQRNHEFDVAADARPGMDAMFGCAPHFNRHSGTGQYDNMILGNFAGFEAWDSCLRGLVQDKPRFIEFVTWNDYLEGSYLGGPYANANLWPTYRGNHFSHDAFRKIGAYYNEWFKKGVEPTVRRDLITIAHRTHPALARGINPNGAGIQDDTDNAQNNSGERRPLARPTSYNVQQDRLYATVMLKEPGTVVLHSGSASQSFALGAGVSEVSMPLSVGAQGVALRRGGNMVLTTTSPTQVQSGAVALFNYNVQTAFAEG